MTTAKTVMMGNIKDEDISAFHAKVMSDVGAMAGVACAAIGDKLGLYRALAVSGDVSAAEFAENTGLDPRYMREWLINQAAGGYINYDASTDKFSISGANAAVLADENSPFYAAGAFQIFSALMRGVPRITECFKTGAGMPWGEQEPDVFQGTERMFRPVYMHRLVSKFIPAVPGLIARLEKGIKVADVGCGHGVSTIEMARAFPQSVFYGFDCHAPSIDRAKQRAHSEGVSDRVVFEVAPANQVPGKNYGLVAFFDCLHDMGDPVTALGMAGMSLTPDGCIMIVEPFGGNKIEENFNAIGRAFSGASVLCCTPNAVASGKHALGTIASDDALAQVAKAGGLSSFRRVLATPFNRVFEAKK